MKTTQEMIAVMIAENNGEQIQCRGIFLLREANWNYTRKPAWDWNHYDYRIKPKQQYKKLTTNEAYCKLANDGDFECEVTDCQDASEDDWSEALIRGIFPNDTWPLRDGDGEEWKFCRIKV